MPERPDDATQPTTSTVAGAPPSDLLHLRAAGVSLVLDLTGLPRVLHWGADLGPLDDDALADLRLAERPPTTGFPVDGVVAPAVLPAQADGWLGTPGLTGSRAGRAWSAAFTAGTPTLTRSGDGGAVLVVPAVDDAAGLGLELVLELTPQGLVRQRATLTNTGDDVYEVAGLLLTLPVPARATTLLDLGGHWARERSPMRTAFTHGTRLRENRRGRTGADAPYVLVAGTDDLAHRRGEAWGWHVAWSGNHRSLAERSHYHSGLLGGGELLEPGEVRLAPGRSYTSPWVYASYGAQGLDALAARFHAWLRARPQHPSSPRPVTLNTWEAVYFEHDLGRLVELADAAAAVGAERFVLDDGWFGSRRDDSRGLGDWYVSQEVWPDGLGPLIEHVTGRGMQFGLWVEPEMVNPDSDLARAHPDWMLRLPDRLPRPARHQQVLDLARPEAYAHILERLDALLTEHDIAYLKWDHNRDLVDAGHGPDGVPGVHAQTLAVYRLLDELRARHPRVEIESCSSGGARVDLEILQRTDRVWASDCIDALERRSIQPWTNLLIPLELIGAHIGSASSHSTGRTAGLGFRAGTALFGHLGIEWDLREADDAQRAELAAWVALYKEVRGLLHSGASVHGDVTDPAYQVQGVVAHDGSDALFAIAAVATSAQMPAGVVVLPGLDPDATYHVRPQAPGDVIRHGWAPPWWTPDGFRATGRVLEQVGLRSPQLSPERLVLLRATRVG
ncbi:alpha-galactosidase [Cellulomonas wangsupingiae]|uniref:alpha-galactosidase n=1 Tax=Cellulomonas wangsupingiae TaxID=2968085 RepID=A0ABY5K8C9_9CELL|nr:alpha-galactosidase [Cellulomonas wangsupingiae]MCC2334857.1 alpha-galactosidase [Cellulomonas wangsupingiae]MCM0638423.1 alpha-galactosidase [Cellulomonas wangsupingiae]UUI66195.1 alpha-galactosidase [Cellulomonas wangsupingiae]